MEASYPSILIVAVNPLSTTANNGKTMASLFRGYPPEAVSQLYFHRDPPTSDVCDNYYRIADEDLIRAARRRASPIGRQVDRDSAPERVVPQALTDLLKSSRAIRLVRALFWTGVDLERGPVADWLDAVNPDIIFFCGGDANYAYKKVHRLADRYGAKIVFYITDDYVLPVPTCNVFAWLGRAWTRRVFVAMTKGSALVLTIGDEMSRVYEQTFGVRSQSVMNLVEVPDAAPGRSLPAGDMTVFSYVGGLHSNREVVLARLVESLERLEARGLRGTLRVYSNHPPSRRFMKALEGSTRASFSGSLDEEGVARVLRDSDVLVHVEADDRKSKVVTRLSVSTKISEYLASGKPILAVGPSDVASIRYLRESGAAFVESAMTSESIDSTVATAIRDQASREACARRAWELAKQNHDARVLRARLHEQLRALAQPGPDAAGSRPV